MQARIRRGEIGVEMRVDLADALVLGGAALAGLALWWMEPKLLILVVGACLMAGGVFWARVRRPPS